MRNAINIIPGKCLYGEVCDQLTLSLPAFFMKICLQSQRVPLKACTVLESSLSIQGGPR